MASTPKVIRRNGGNCVCLDGWTMDDDVMGGCKAGYCHVARCPKCGGIRFDAGPVACPHKKHENPRWTRYPGMKQPGRWDWDKDDFVPARAAVKPSISRRRHGGAGRAR